MIECLEDTFNIQAVRLGRDRVTGASRGFGFIVSSLSWRRHLYLTPNRFLLKEFPTTEDSQKFMESPASADLKIRNHPLFTNYSNAPSPGNRVMSDGVHMDWMCNMCGAINFARLDLTPKISWYMSLSDDLSVISVALHEAKMCKEWVMSPWVHPIFSRFQD